MKGISMSWSGGLIDWVENDTAYVSVVFSWLLPRAYQRCVWYKAQGYRVRAGGSAVWFRPYFLADVAEIGGEVDAIVKHNPDATTASRGCPLDCYFCLVPKMDGREFTFIPEFTPRPVLCDANLSALPIDYQEYIIQKYMDTDTLLLDACQGFEPRTFNEDTYNRWKEINKGDWRFAFDMMEEERYVKNVMDILKHLSPRKKRVYVLIGNEPKKECLYRINRIIEWGGEPFVQPYIELRSLKKKPVVRFDWTETELKDMARWANRYIWRVVPFSEYKNRKDET